jgi:hypothetical protein
MSPPSMPRCTVEHSDIEVPQIDTNDDLGELVRKLSLCVTQHSCSMLCSDGEAARDYTLHPIVS